MQVLLNLKYLKLTVIFILMLLCSNMVLAQGYLGIVNEHELTQNDFEVVSTKKSRAQPDIIVTTKVLRHRQLALHITQQHIIYGRTKVIGKKIKLQNTGEQPLQITKMPSLALNIPLGDYEYSVLENGWSQELKLNTRKFNNSTWEMISDKGRSSEVMSPWFAFREENKGKTYLGQLAWSGNWQMRFRSLNKHISLELGEYFDNGQLNLLPGASIELPEAVYAIVAGDLDDAANALHRYQREYVIPVNARNNPPLVQFNSWFPYQNKLTLNQAKDLINDAADLGCEAFVLDAGWYNQHNWQREVGNWHSSRTLFPNGLGELAAYSREKGLKFGIWFEIESLGDSSALYHENPEWCLQRKGQAATSGNRYHLDFSNPEAFNWALQSIENIMQECNGLDWVKLDYNIAIGSEFETLAGDRPGNLLHNHVQAYYRFLDTLRQRHPDLIVENCASGALRYDLGIVAHTHTSWISDETTPAPSLALAWGSTLQFLPRINNHWVVGKGNHNPNIDQTLPPGYWDYMFRIPMNGQFGISSRVFDWQQPLLNTAKENVKLYKKIRTVIADADTYHLTPQPDYKQPQGWMALQYVAPGAAKSVIMVYRMENGAPAYQAFPRGLQARRKYEISIDGESRGKFQGRVLAKKGINVHLPTDFRAAIVEIKALK